MKPKTDISALLRILMACERAGTVSFLGYCDPSFITKVLYNCFICKDCGFPATDTRIACIYMASGSVVLVAE